MALYDGMEGVYFLVMLWQKLNRENQSEERKTRFVPGTLVQGTMDGPIERNQAALCEKRERSRGSKQVNKLKHVLEDHHVWITQLLRIVGCF